MATPAPSPTPTVHVGDGSLCSKFDTCIQAIAGAVGGLVLIVSLIIVIISVITAVYRKKKKARRKFPMISYYDTLQPYYVHAALFMMHKILFHPCIHTLYR